MYLQLRDLIRAVRCAKTAAEERNVIQKESAGIRTSLKETNSQDVRFNNIQKLLYIYLLGYPVKFGQLECLKLVASNKYSDKRVGYLGVMVLLDEKQEILTLLTNSLKNDLQSTDDYIVGLALCTLSALASEEVSRDLTDDVIKLINSSRSFIKKKAVLAALRIIKKVPESIESFLPRARSLLGDKNHGVQIGTTALLAQMCTSDPVAADQIQKLVPIIARQLRILISSASTDHDVSGVSDPFLQIGFLRMLRILAAGSTIVADEINDILTQIMSQTDDSKNVGTAVLYEAIKVVLAIPSEKSLRVLAINLLGKFLEHKDNNVRCVALKMLLEAMVTEAPSVLRVQSIIVQCLRDSDSSIRHHALDLTFALINASNVQKLSTELIEYLPICDEEFKATMAHKLFVITEVFSPSNEWSTQMKIKTMYLAGEYVSSNDMFLLISNFCNEATSDSELQRYFTRVVFSAMKKRLQTSNGTEFNPYDKFAIISAWILGEFGDLAIDQSIHIISGQKSFTMTETEILSIEVPSIDDIVDMLIELVKVKHSFSPIALTSLAKLTSRGLLTASLKSSVLSTFKTYTNDPVYELQSRSVQFNELFKEGSGVDSTAILEKMPAPTFSLPTISKDELNPAVLKANGLSHLISADGDSPESSQDLTLNFQEKKKQPPTSVTIFEDLLGLMDVQPSSATNNVSSPNLYPQSVLSPNQPSSENVQSLLDLDISGLSLSNPTSSNANDKQIGLQGIPANRNSTAANSSAFQDLSNVNPTSSSSSSVAVTTPSMLNQELADRNEQPGFNVDYQAYFKNNVRISMRPQKNPMSPDIVEIAVKVLNVGSENISSFSFQVAVPKNQRLQMLPPSGTEMNSNSSEITQSIRIANPLKAPIRLRMRISYKSDSNDSFVDVAEFSSFGQSVC